jgi:hypothetical protein
MFIKNAHVCVFMHARTLSLGSIQYHIEVFISCITGTSYFLYIPDLQIDEMSIGDMKNAFQILAGKV